MDSLNFLEFERPIEELQHKIAELRRVVVGPEINLSEELARLENKSIALRRSIFSSLTAQQIVQLARHPLRPYTLDYIERIFTDFDELAGDRHRAEDLAIVGGLARLDGEPVMVMGHQKGRTTREKINRNFGMASPEGFRKAQRLMQLAERFRIPIITFIDTPGAYPGVTAEECNQSEAIARNLLIMAELRTPIVCAVIGEGCSGGALALGVGDKLLMLQYSYYSVISPEGCASILWKSAAKAAEAASALDLTADRLAASGLIDEVVEEPLGGAHRDMDAAAASLRSSIVRQLSALQVKPLDTLLEERYQRWLKVGKDDVR